MVSNMWGKKVGMTQIFVNDKVVPVTAINVGDWLVTGIRNKERDGYDAIQVGCLKKRHAKTDFSIDWLKSIKKYFSMIKEIKVSQAVEDIEIGKPVDFYNHLNQGDKVDVFGITKGHGFAGVVKRHDFAGPPASHGSTMGKKPGSIGFMTSQGKVIKGKAMPGHMGVDRRVMRNLEVVKIEKDAPVVLVKGSIPGHVGSYVFIRKA